jgi:glutamine synthetase
MDNSDKIRNFLEIPYDQLEELNLHAKKLRFSLESEEKIKAHYLDYLEKEKRLKAVTIGFADIEGRFHMLDYDKKFFIKNFDNLTFDGSSIRGFSRQAESDLRLKVDWRAFWWLPADVFGPGKLLLMADIYDKDNQHYPMDMRGVLKKYLAKLEKKYGYTFYVSNEVEGFLVKGENAEQNFDERFGFDLASQSGYYHSLPNDILRQFIDSTAEAQRAMAFENEKDHPEVAPSQFELNYAYSPMINAADQILLYKLVARQVARNMGMTATFLPKPVMGINGSGMHTNLSIFKNNKNLFYDHKKGGVSDFSWEAINKILNFAEDFCLIMNSSVNAYRRLDPHFEAPNEIKVSEMDRGAMIRIPLFKENSARIEVRSVAPDANPYLLFYTLAAIIIEGKAKEDMIGPKKRISYLPSKINFAIAQFRKSELMTKILGEEFKKRFIALKQAAADRCPDDLGTKVKNGEVWYHHEVYNQWIWNNF